jgi:C4-dicarboxylate transporter
MVLVASLFFAACDDSVSPSDGSLDGAWTTGHAISGLEMAFNLAWVGDIVVGSGNYKPFANTDVCGGPALGLGAFGQATITAKRTANTVMGSLSFDTGLRLSFTGTLTGSGGQGTRIDASFVKPDGATCLWGLIQGQAP